MQKTQVIWPRKIHLDYTFGRLQCQCACVWPRNLYIKQVRLLHGNSLAFICSRAIELTALAANGTIYERRSEEEGMQEVYSVGDRVVYPMHGAGLIEAIEEREILGEKDHYYIMRLQMGDMKVMVPRGSAEEVGLRPIIDSDQVPKVYEVLKAEATPMSQNWNRRYRANMEKMKTGDIFVVAEVVRNLGIRDREKGLSTGERRMLDNAKQILASELAMVEGRSLEEVTSGIEEILS